MLSKKTAMNFKSVQGKVICIGLHKTGTSSVGLALLELGYTVLGAREDLADSLLQEDLDKALKIAEPFDALQDVPWALLYKELDDKYPNSKFILTERDEKQWIKSAVNHFGTRYIPLHKWIYGLGVVKGNEAIYLEKYRRHYSDVKDYFKHRNMDLLIVSLTDGNNWENICSFLNQKIPDKKFPISNKGKHNLNLFENFYGVIRDSIPVNIRRFILNILGKSDKRNRFNNHHINKAYRDSIKKSTRTSG